MKKEKILKIIITIVYLILAILLFISFIDSTLHSDAMGINFVCSLPLLPLSGFALIYAIKSIKNIFKNNIKITILDKIIFILFITILIISLLETL